LNETAVYIDPYNENIALVKKIEYYDKLANKQINELFHMTYKLNDVVIMPDGKINCDFNSTYNKRKSEVILYSENEYNRYLKEKAAELEIIKKKEELHQISLIKRKEAEASSLKERKEKSEGENGLPIPNVQQENISQVTGSINNTKKYGYKFSDEIIKFGKIDFIEECLIRCVTNKEYNYYENLKKLVNKEDRNYYNTLAEIKSKYKSEGKVQFVKVCEEILRLGKY
jgi:hypothetical protein